VAAVTDRFPGPKYVGPQAQRFRGDRQPHSPDLSVDYCSGCRVCNEACPNGVKVAELNIRAKAQIAQDRGIPLRNWLLGRNEMLGKVGSVAPHLANLAMHNPASRLLAERVLGIHRQAPIPRWSTGGTFGAWLRRTQSQRLTAERKVVYFHGCSTMYYEPSVGQAAIAVLEHNGYQVLVPPQNCCGLPMLNNGEFPAAAGLYRRNVSRLLPYVDAGYPIVGTSISCVLTLREEAAELLDIDDEGSRSIRQATWDICEWLRDLLNRGQLRTDFQPLPLVLPYHASCQLRAHRMGRPAIDVLSLVPGLDLRDSDARCCGLAGTYGYKVEKYDIAMQVGQEAFRFIAEQGPDVRLVAADSEICRWQLEHGTGKPARHPVEILAAAYGLYDLERRRLIGQAG